MPTMKAISYYNWARENRATIWGADEINLSPGYIQQETKRLIAIKGGVK